MEPSHIQPTPHCTDFTRELLSRVGDKWSILIVAHLAPGPMRFNTLKRTIGQVSQRMLTLTLRGLERDGLVKRTVTPSIPPRVNYELRKLGRSLGEKVRALGQWAFDNQPAIETARKKYDAQAERALAS